MHKDVERILVSEEEIQKRSKELGEEITRDYAGKTPIVVGLLKGSIPFMAELLKNIDLDCTIDFIRVSSYEGTQSSTLLIKTDLDGDVTGKDIIIVEDILDTGKTLDVITKHLLDKGANSVEICTLLDKKEGRKVEIEAKYVGYTIPLEFVIGFGLDYNEKYRNLPYVGVLKKSCW